jgi:Protein of unknown function (DUF674)
VQHNFIITDDLTVMQLSTPVVSNFLDCAGKNMDTIIEKQVNIGMSEVNLLSLLFSLVIKGSNLSNFVKKYECLLFLLNFISLRFMERHQN